MLLNRGKSLPGLAAIISKTYIDKAGRNTAVNAARANPIPSKKILNQKLRFRFLRWGIVVVVVVVGHLEMIYIDAFKITKLVKSRSLAELLFADDENIYIT